VSQYASAAALAATGVRAEALTGVDVDTFLTDASATIDSFLRTRGYALPLTGVLTPANTYPVPLPQAAIAIATYNLLVFRGFNPDQYDANYEKQRDFWLGTPGMKGWLDKLAEGKVSIDAPVATVTDTLPGEGTAVLGALSRGWDAEGLNQIGEPMGHFWNHGKP